ncbi:MAG: hypothetical protein AAB966_02650 [Patescibacteria group bacterium]
MKDQERTTPPPKNDWLKITPRSHCLIQHPTAVLLGEDTTHIFIIPTNLKSFGQSVDLTWKNNLPENVNLSEFERTGAVMYTSRNDVSIQPMEFARELEVLIPNRWTLAHGKFSLHHNIKPTHDNPIPMITGDSYKIDTLAKEGVGEVVISHPDASQGKKIKLTPGVVTNLNQTNDLSVIYIGGEYFAIRNLTGRYIFEGPPII